MRCRVALCSWNSPEFAALAAVSAPGKQEYCDRHGYTFVPREAPFEDGWQRYDLANELLQSGDYDMVLSMDADAMVMNHTLRVERLYIEGKSFHIADDIFGTNDGVYLAVNTQLCRQMFAALIALGRHTVNKAKEAGGYAPDTQQLLRSFIDFGQYKQIVKKERPAEFNAYKNALYNRPDWFEGTYDPGAWILQFPGLHNDVRLPLMQEALQEVIRG